MSEHMFKIGDKVKDPNFNDVLTVIQANKSYVRAQNKDGFSYTYQPQNLEPVADENLTPEEETKILISAIEEGEKKKEYDRGYKAGLKEAWKLTGELYNDKNLCIKLMNGSCGFILSHKVTDVIELWKAYEKEEQEKERRAEEMGIVEELTRAIDIFGRNKIYAMLEEIK